MSHHWESGFMVHEPSWHRLERAVLQSSPDNWEDARKEAGLEWDVESEPVHVGPAGKAVRATGWQAIVRDDKMIMDPARVLAVQPETYRVIHNSEFGEVIDTLLGIQDSDAPVVFEALMSLYGGRQVVALCYFEEPLKMNWDPSKTYSYLALSSRHDGQGGLRGLPTNVRVQCANTLSLAESIDGRTTGFTIRHTSNWNERLAEISRGLIAARGESKKWLEFAEDLARWSVSQRDTEHYLKRLMPISDDMSNRQIANRTRQREKVQEILVSPTCAEIKDTGYGLLMAATEWSDHHRNFQTDDSLVSRQILRKEPMKARAASILRDMARV